MLTIRLQRRGRKNDPSFRVVVLDSKRAPKTGKYLEMVGSYDARVDRVELKGERILHWMKNGAQVSDTVHNLLISKGIVEGKKINVLPRKSPPKKEEEVKAEAAAPSADTPAEAPVEEPKAEVQSEAPTAEAPKEDVSPEASAKEEASA